MPGRRAGPDRRQSGEQMAAKGVDDLPIGMRFDQPDLCSGLDSLMLCGLVNPLEA